MNIIWLTYQTEPVWKSLHLYFTKLLHNSITGSLHLIPHK